MFVVCAILSFKKIQNPTQFSLILKTKFKKQSNTHMESSWITIHYSIVPQKKYNWIVLSREFGPFPMTKLFFQLTGFVSAKLQTNLRTLLVWLPFGHRHFPIVLHALGCLVYTHTHTLDCNCLELWIRSVYFVNYCKTNWRNLGIVIFLSRRIRAYSMLANNHVVITYNAYIFGLLVTLTLRLNKGM